MINKLLILLISTTLYSCSDIENPLAQKAVYKPINKVYDSRAIVGASDINPKFIPILKYGK